MQLIGFVLACIGLMVFFFAKRIVQGKTKCDPNDEKEWQMLTAGAVIAVKLAGGVVLAIGLVFLAIGNMAG